MTKVEKNPERMSQNSKECHDKVKELKEKIFIAKKKFMSRHFLGAIKNEKLVATKFLCHDTRHSCRDNH